jgi:hypothetical protein
MTVKLTRQNEKYYAVQIKGIALISATYLRQLLYSSMNITLAIVFL